MSAGSRVDIGIEARELSHRFAPGRGLSATSFAHAGPGCLAVVGPNGAGKSTLLRVVAGLLRPNGGAFALELDGRPVEPSRRRHVVGFVSPELAFYDELTVGENLAFVCEARGLLDGRARICEALTRVGLTERSDDRVAALSSGMRQRLRLAFAVLHRPPVLLLDEPSSHLDAAGRAVTEAIVADWRRDTLVLVATNDEREASHADERIELRGGLGDPA